MTKKLKIQLVIFAVSILFNVWGILSILTAGMGVNTFLTYMTSLRNWHILVCYVIIVITMAIGIMSSSINAAQLDNKKWNKGLTIGITIYSTILTIPLLLAFICFLTFDRAELSSIGAMGIDAFAEQDFIVSMFGSIAWDFHKIFVEGFGWSEGGLTALYVGGVVMSIIFLAVPIYSAYDSLKKLKKREQEEA